jgi:hypothetical protein
MEREDDDDDDDDHDNEIDQATTADRIDMQKMKKDLNQE